MKAVGFKKSLPIEEDNSLIDFETDIPELKERDILVRIKAISVNPVDYKVRQSAAKDSELAEPRIIGWDAAGTIERTGDKVSLFQPGDEVYYAGDITRPGCYAEYQAVDERIVAKIPKLSWEEAAALPLTTLTAWESIFDRLKIKENGGAGKSILIIGGAGGVGSIAIQLLKKLTKLKVIATASRDVTRNWCEKMGADEIVNHHDLIDQMKNYKNVDYILNFSDTDLHWDNMAHLIAPQGAICCIVKSRDKVDLNALNSKSVSFHWELMFTRSMYKTNDMIAQHKILKRLGVLVDEGKIRSTLHKKYNGLGAETLKEVHQLQESGKSVGKNVILF